MKPIGAFLALTFVALLLRSTALSSLATRGVVLDVLAFATVVWALRHGDAWGASFGFVLGLVADLDAARWLGRHSLALSLLGYAMGRLSSTLVRESARTQFALLAVVTLAHQVWSASFEIGGGIVGRAVAARAGPLLQRAHRLRRHRPTHDGPPHLRPADLRICLPVRLAGLGTTASRCSRASCSRASRSWCWGCCGCRSSSTTTCSASPSRTGSVSTSCARRAAPSVTAPDGCMADNQPSFDVVFRPMPAESSSRARARVDSDWLARVSALVMDDTLAVRRRIEEANRTGQTAMLRRNAPYAVMAAVEEMRGDVPGVDVQVAPIRRYPEGTLGAQLLGYAGEINDQELEQRQSTGYRMGDLIGKTGVERRYEEVLRGQDGAEFVVVNAMGKRVSTLREGPPRLPMSGHDVTLTIDLDVQRALEDGHGRRRSTVRRSPWTRGTAPCSPW